MNTRYGQVQTVAPVYVASSTLPTKLTLWPRTLYLHSGQDVARRAHGGIAAGGDDEVARTLPVGPRRLLGVRRAHLHHRARHGHLFSDRARPTARPRAPCHGWLTVMVLAAAPAARLHMRAVEHGQCDVLGHQQRWPAGAAHLHHLRTRAAHHRRPRRRRRVCVRVAGHRLRRVRAATAASWTSCPPPPPCPPRGCRHHEPGGNCNGPARCNRLND